MRHNGNIWKSLALLFAGALASVIGGLLFPNKCIWLLGAIVFILILILYGSGAISKMWHGYNLWKRKGNKLTTLKVGILNDMGWDPKNTESHVCTDLSPGEWKKELEERAKKNKVRINVELINVRKNFDLYRAILNPYGGVYPEHDLKDFETLDKVLSYVNEGGLFINIADIPGYWAYNAVLRRRLDATPPIYGIERVNSGISIIPIRSFERTPFMEKLGLRVLNIENHELSKWKVEFQDEFGGLKESIDEIKVHRVVVVERNVEAIIKTKPVDKTDRVTPFFSVNYGEGKVLVSLVFIDKEYPQNNNMKIILAKVIIEVLREKK